jgi:membrane protein
MSKKTKSPNLLIETYQNWREDRTLRLGAGLAYYALFAVVPIITLMFLVATRFFSAQEVESFIDNAINVFFGDSISGTLTSESDGSSLYSNITVGSIGFIGVVSLLISSSFIFLALQDALDVIWHNPVRKGWKKLALRYILAYSVVLIASSLVFIMLAVQSIGSLTLYIIPNLPTLENLAGTIISIGTWSIAIPFLAVIFRALIYTKISWKALFIGSTITSFLMIFGSIVLSVYLSKVAANSITGAIGGVFLVLLWIYYEAQIVLIGAQLTKVISRRID